MRGKTEVCVGELPESISEPPTSIPKKAPANNSVSQDGLWPISIILFHVIIWWSDKKSRNKVGQNWDIWTKQGCPTPSSIHLGPQNPLLLHPLVLPSYSPLYWILEIKKAIYLHRLISWKPSLGGFNFWGKNEITLNWVILWQTFPESWLRSGLRQSENLWPTPTLPPVVPTLQFWNSNTRSNQAQPISEWNDPEI